MDDDFSSTLCFLLVKHRLTFAIVARFTMHTMPYVETERRVSAFFNECEVINIFSCISCFCSYRLYNVGNNFTDGKCILRKFVIQKTKSTRDTAEISSSLRVIVILLQREMVQFRAYMY